MADPLNHYHDREKTWRWGIPEKPRRSGWWLVAAIAALALALALLLAGCAKKPAPTPQHTEIAPDGWKTTKGGVDMRDGERLVDAMQMALIREGARLDRAKQDTEIAVLKRRVAELEKRLKVATAARHGWIDYDIDGASISMSSELHPIARFHYDGGAWCNVWADDKGLHWEACK